MLQLVGVRGGYGRVKVLHDIDLVVPPGSAVALLGANGAGKSTLLKLAAGLVPASAGRVLLGGEDVTHKSTFERARKGLCLIPEGRGIFRQLTVRENLHMHCAGRAEGAAIDEAIEFFPRLGERLHQVAGTLSGGEQQMLAVARALMTSGQVVMADELSVGLAPAIVDEILAAVATLRASGRSLLIVEQYVDRVLELADYVYILHKGRVVFVGEPDQCRDHQIFDRYMGSVA
jgi:branched-chain amino acid transport system ATP-binding protein